MKRLLLIAAMLACNSFGCSVPFRYWFCGPANGADYLECRIAYGEPSNQDIVGGHLVVQWTGADGELLWTCTFEQMATTSDGRRCYDGKTVKHVEGEPPMNFTIKWVLIDTKTNPNRVPEEPVAPLGRR